MLFDVQTRPAGDSTTIAVVGDVDLSALPRLMAALDAVHDGPLHVDLRSVDWFDPVCLGVLLAADRKARRRGATMTVTASGAAADLLGECGLDRILEISRQA